MWFRSLRLDGRRLLATIRAGAHLFASARREPRAGCARAAGCRDPHLRSAHLQPAHHPASKGARRLVRSPASQLALPEPSRSFAGGHAIPIMRPHVHQPYGRCNICQDIAVCLKNRYLFSGSRTWATRNGPGRVHFRRPASDLSTSSSSVVTRRSAQWRSKPRRPFSARVLAPLTFLMPVRTPRQLFSRLTRGIRARWPCSSCAGPLGGLGGRRRARERPPPPSPAAPTSPRVALAR